MTPPALVVAAPATGSGKTTVVLALLRAFREAGLAVAGAKVGPDYIDPRFHEAAAGQPCLTLDPWAMRTETVDGLVVRAAAELLIVEGVMGLFDGARDGTGSTADLAERLDWPVLLVVDAGRMGQSVAALVHGFASFRPRLSVAGVILNRVAGAEHEALLRRTLSLLGVPVLGALPRRAELALPDRHLGLVQAAEHPDIERLLADAAEAARRHLDLAAIRATARPGDVAPHPAEDAAIPPLGQRIAVAADEAFAFAYPHLLEGWRRSGAEIVPFSPLAGEAPRADADAVYLPGGYPELQAGRLASAHGFLDGLRAAALRGAAILGECGGYMVLGDGLVDAGGARHAMAGLLPLETSFAAHRLHLGYRRARLLGDAPLGAAGSGFRGHEFHYATVLREGAGDPLYEVAAADQAVLRPVGRRRGAVMGSFLHVIDRS